MPEKVKTAFHSEKYFDDDIQRVDDWLYSIGINPRDLLKEELEKYCKDGLNFKQGRRIYLRFPDTIRRGLDILFPAYFPLEEPRIALAGESKFRIWPHIERNGMICFDSEKRYPKVSSDPCKLVEDSLEQACKLIERLASGERVDKDFHNEFSSYCKNEKNIKVYSLINLSQHLCKDRAIFVMRRKRSDDYVIGDSKQSIKDWAKNRDFGEEDICQAYLFWIDGYFIPERYPDSLADVQELVKDKEQLSNLASKKSPCILVLLGIVTRNGPALIFIRAKISKKERKKKTNLCKLNAIQRYNDVSTACVTRVDPEWIHGRGQNEGANTLHEKIVAIIGCGSIGAPVAVLLAQSGVGKFILIDPDIVEWSNISRHPLGASCVNKQKVKALREKLLRDFPHKKIDIIAEDLTAVLHKYQSALASADLIVATPGALGAETQLDSWHAATGRVRPILYGWTEEYACAGHGTLICKDGSYQDGFDHSTGEPIQITGDKWKKNAERQEPACGAIFYPYGPIEISFINTMISQLAIDALLGNQTSTIHRIWVASNDMLAKLGGNWSDDYKRLCGETPGMHIFERRWNK